MPEEGIATPNIWTVIQARTRSTRRPGKVLVELLGKRVIEHVVERAEKIGYPVCLAIPDDDTPLETVCMTNDWRYIVGSEDDVLDRFWDAATATRAEHVIRVTGDCPFLDSVAARATVDWHLETGADFTQHVAEGRGVEVFTRGCLHRCWRAARGDEREHIDLYVLRNPSRFKIQTVKFSVDTNDDLETARRRAEWL